MSIMITLCSSGWNWSCEVTWQGSHFEGGARGFDEGREEPPSSASQFKGQGKSQETYKTCNGEQTKKTSESRGDSAIEAQGEFS